MKRLLKQNHGMTLMEILVALTLLMIVIVGTTPVMLSAFDGLYTAGEFTQDTYEAKSEVEDKLATRNTKDIYNPGFQVNFQNIGEVANINARRAVSSLKGSLETLFSNGKVHIAIVSAKNVNDDYAGDGYHEVIIQTSNLDFGDDVKRKEDAAAKISLNNEADVKNGDADRKKIIDLTFIIPNKQKTDKEGNVAGDAEIYTYKDNPETQEVESHLANIEEDAKGNAICDVDHITGRITVKINGFDFTQSPIKIRASYLDENNKKQVTETYLFIDQPTIMAVGETNKTDSEGNRIAYYTTPGVVEVPDKTSTTGAKEKVFEIYPRTMRTENATGTLPVKKFDSENANAPLLPENTIFKSVNWITESTPEGELLDNSYASSYYVITGTNGAIYRTYAMTGFAEKKITGKIDLDTSEAKFNGINQDGVDVAGVLDKDIILADKYATIVYPAFWGADFSHIYGYSTYADQNGYLGTNNWYTEDGDTGKGKPGYYSNRANFGYYYSGYGMSFTYYTQNSWKISYILTERENALRVGGVLNQTGHYDGKYNRIWERPYKWDPNLNEGKGDWETQETKKEIQAMSAYYYKSNYTWPTLSRCTIVSGDGDIDNYNDKVPNNLPTYYTGDGNRGRPDNGFAQLRIKASTTLSPTFVYDRWKKEKGDGTDKENGVKFVYDNDENLSQIAVTDSVYIPATSTTPGGMFYVGTVAAYTMIYQSDAFAIHENSNAIYNEGNYNVGSTTSYYVLGNADGETTTVAKWSSPIRSTGRNSITYDGFEYSHDYNRLLMTNDFGAPYTVEGAETDKVRYSMNTPESRAFFIPSANGESTNSGDERGNASYKRVLFDDVMFTMGFASNREMVYTKIVYGDLNPGAGTKLEEARKSYEQYYFLSHWDDAEHEPTLYMNDSIGAKQMVVREKPWHGVEINPKDNENKPVPNPTTGYKNHINNDYYNVWFPGEMYNLTKVASKDGVTVSVGYAVSGSTYTWINGNDTSKSSTALGSIYNDGVLAAMVLGVDNSFTNLLYYKDQGIRSVNMALNTSNDSGFDDNSLSGRNAGYTSTFSTGYGTHGRDSIQFTAVDLSVEKTDVKKDTSGEITEWTDRYYAYYADNKGRVYRSLVATKKDDGSVDMVSHIADQKKVLDSNGKSTRNAPSYMEEQKIGDKSIGEYFEKITSIKADGGLVIVTGYSKEGFCIVVGTISEEGNAPTWKIVKGSGCDATYKVNDMHIRDGYVYIAGSKTSGGFVFAVEMAALKIAANNDPVSGKTATTAGALYAIAGQ